MTRIARVLLVMLLIVSGYTAANAKTVAVYDEDTEAYYYHDDGKNNIYLNIFVGMANNMENSEGGISAGLNLLYTTTPNLAMGLSFAYHAPYQFEYSESLNTDIYTGIDIFQSGLITRYYIVPIPGCIINPFIHLGVTFNLYKVSLRYDLEGGEDYDREVKELTGNMGLEAGLGFLVTPYVEISGIYRTSSAANFVAICFGLMF